MWVTIVSLLAWLAVMDLGIANGLPARLSAAYGKGNDAEARNYIAAAFWGLAAIAALIGAGAALAWPALDWGRLLNLGAGTDAAEASAAVGVAIAIFLVGLPFTIVHKVLLAYQQGAVSNAVQLLTSIAGLAAIMVVTRTGGDLPDLVAAFSGGQLGVAVLAAAWLFAWFKPQLAPLRMPSAIHMRDVFALGGFVLVLQISALVMYQKDILLISHLYGPAQSAAYSIVWQMFFYLSTINVIVAPYLAPALGEAYAKGELAWMRRAFARHMAATLGVSLPVVLLLIAFHRPLLDLWVGPEIRPSFATVAGIGVFTLVQAALYPVNALLIGLGRVRRYALFSALASVLCVPLSIGLLREVGVAGPVYATSLCFGLLVLVPCLREALRVLGHGPTVFPGKPLPTKPAVEETAIVAGDIHVSPLDPAR